jgi:group I intron endonuclease
MNNQNEDQNDIMPKIEKGLLKEKCKIIGIYGLRNKVNGKWYVGQSINVEERWKDYKRLKCKKQRKLYAALLKYGYDNFETVLIENCEKDYNALNARETYWIQEYNSVNEGYNITFGGGNRKLTDETKRKIGEKSRNRKHTKEAIEKIKTARALQKPTPMCPLHMEKLRIISRTRIVSQDTRNKMRAARLGKKHSQETKNKMRSFHKI